jgi:hypothetical protein
MRKFLACVIASLVVQPAPCLADSPAVFAHLKLLAGEWEAELPGFGKLTASVHLVSNGTAIEEIIGTPKDNELSVYTLNVDKILLTHYCAMTPDGHQVHLQASRLGSESDPLEFHFVSATNLHTLSAPHMRRVTMMISDRDHYSERWIKTENRKDTVFNLNFVRRQSAE